MTGPRCRCGRLMGRRALSCIVCREAAKNARRRLKYHATEMESEAEVERKLALVDAQRKARRWAA